MPRMAIRGGFCSDYLLDEPLSSIPEDDPVVDVPQELIDRVNACEQEHYEIQKTLQQLANANWPKP